MFRPSLTAFKKVPCPKSQHVKDCCDLLHCPFLHESTPVVITSPVKRHLSSTSYSSSSEATNLPLSKKPRIASLSDVLVLIPRSFPEGSYPPSPIHQRLTYLTALSSAFKEQKISPPNKKAIEKEFEIARKSSKLVYGSNMKQLIRKVKKGEYKPEEQAIKTLSKNQDLLTSLSEEQLYDKLKLLIHNERVLLKNNFITAVPSTRAEPDITNMYICDRCKNSFSFKTHTTPTCSFHDRKKYKSSFGDLHWECCDEKVGDTQGCQTLSYHVFKPVSGQELHDLIPFVKTPTNISQAKTTGSRNIIGLDCEMGYTSKGLELIRLTIVDFVNPKVTLFDELIKPSGKILDLNSKWSGVSAIPENAKSLNKLHKLLFEGGEGKPSLITKDTIIVGHGLENDMNALRIVHPLLVDSSILYPKGLNWKYSLRDLSMLINGVKIQQGRSGHSSEEDSIAAINVIKGYMNGVRLKN